MAVAVALPATAEQAAPSREPSPTSRAASPSAQETRAATSLRRTIEADTRSRLRQQRAPQSAGLQAEIDTLVDDGAVGVVARVDSPARRWAGASGVRAYGTSRTAQPSNRFRVASNTKMMVATLVMQEVERGTWTLETEANDVVPGLFPGRAVTVGQLLSHTSGAPDGVLQLILLQMTEESTWQDYFDIIGADYTDEQIIAVANALPWGTPGAYGYSNSGYVALGMMLEQQTGSDVGTLLERRVFRKAGMRYTSYAVTRGIQGPSLIGSGHTAEGVYSTAGFNPRLFGAAGAVVSTTEDLNRFIDALLDGRLVSRATLESMTTSRSDAFYGLGLMKLPDPCTPMGAPQQYVYGHNGAAFGTWSWALSSADGRRQVSLGATGRYYTDPAGTQPYDLDRAVLALLRATC